MEDETTGSSFLEYGKLGAGIWNAWNINKNAGNMYDLGKKNFALSEKEFDTNMKMQWDMYARELDRKKRNQASFAFHVNNPDATKAERGAAAIEISNNTNREYADVGYGNEYDYKTPGTDPYTGAQGVYQPGTMAPQGPILTGAADPSTPITPAAAAPVSGQQPVGASTSPGTGYAANTVNSAPAQNVNQSTRPRIGSSDFANRRVRQV